MGHQDSREYRARHGPAVVRFAEGGGESDNLIETNSFAAPLEVSGVRGSGDFAFVLIGVAFARGHSYCGSDDSQRP